MMTYFEQGHEGGSITPVPQPEVPSFEVCGVEATAIPNELVGQRADRIVKGFRRMQLKHIAEGHLNS